MSVLRTAWEYAPEFVRSRVHAARYGALPHAQWLREVMNRDVRAVLDGLGPADLDIVEISGDNWGDLPWRSRAVLEFPGFDLCDPASFAGPFDLVLCEQVLEHVEDPLAAVRTLRRLCKPEGHVLVSTPFLLRLHGHPEDFWRFTPAGMEKLLTSQGLSPVWVRSWGNRRAVRANLGRWATYRRGRSLRNEADVPMVVWALAHP
jgi:SAM-dependent methyltransferase